MADDGDVITYQFTGSSQTEALDAIDEVIIQQMDGAAGGDAATDGSDPSELGGDGGRIENVTIDVASFDTLDIFVGEQGGDGEAISPTTAIRGSGGIGDEDGEDGEIGYAKAGDDNASVASGGGGGSTIIAADGTTLATAHAGGGAGDSVLAVDFVDGEQVNDTASASAGAGAVVGSGGGGGGTTGGGSGSTDLNNSFVKNSGTQIDGGASGGNAEVTLEFVALAPEVVAGGELPPDGTTDVTLNPTLAVDVSSPVGESFDVQFRDAVTNDQIGETQQVVDSGTASVVWSDRTIDSTFSWFVELDDGIRTAESETFSFTTLPGIPQNLSAAQDFSETTPTVDLSFDDPDEEDGILIFRAEGPSPTFPDEFTQIAALDANSTAFRDTPPDFDTTFTYRATGDYGDEESEPSNEATLTTGSEGVLALTITGTNSPVKSGEQLEVDVDVENNGDYRVEDELILEIEEQ